MADAEAISILEAIARDPELKPTARLRALEQLERWRRTAGADAPVILGDEVAEDPMGDLDELETARQKRRRRKAS